MVVDSTSIDSYQNSKLIYSSNKSLIYHGYRKSDRQPVIIKLINNSQPNFQELIRLRNQYTITKELNLHGIIQSYSLEHYQNRYALVMEDFGGRSLLDYCNRKLLEIEQFLNIAIKLAEILVGLYKNRVIHKDIKPGHILINPETQQLKLIDFGIASLLPRENQIIKNPNLLEGTLAYLSPEQTGRMNRGIDYRTDFYSLGVTFYQLLTGQLPFQSNEPMELVHCHLAKIPLPVHQVNSQVPIALSNIVSKLMAKNAEDRYQNALGLKYDLQQCLTQWQATGNITEFEIAQQDKSDRFSIPEKLYGREKEVQNLIQAFERVALGNSELMLVAGYSGIGKTAIVNEVHKPIVAQRSYFIQGKYEQFNRNIPFSGFLQAFSRLIRQILSETDQQLEQWRSKILEALGENGQVIVEVIPELEKIIGLQPEVVALAGDAAQNRFNLLFEKFIAVFTTQQHPLVIFLDDLQWADSASLNLIKLLISETTKGYLLLIGTYRDNEVDSAHPLMLTLAEIEQTKTTINQISLAPLTESQVNQLLADTFNYPGDITLPLTQLVYQKTQGNPFFTNQFLKALQEDGLIVFNFELGLWQWDLIEIQELAITDNIIEFIVIQLQKLPQASQEVLKLAACIGNQFDLNSLAIAAEKSEVEIAQELWQVLQEGLILPTTENYKYFKNLDLEIDDQGLNLTENTVNLCSYRFLHDRIQQAAYSLIPQEQKKLTHLKIGENLLNSTPETQIKDKIFDIVNQLNIARDLITQPSKRAKLIELNSLAANTAKASTAYQAAKDYLAIAIELLLKDSWESHYELTHTLYVEAVEVAFLSHEFVQMESLIEITLQKTSTLLDRLKVYEIKLQAYQVQEQQLQAIELGRKILQELGVILPESVTPLQIVQKLENTLAKLAGRNIESLINLPLMKDAKALFALQIMISLVPSIYQTAPYLFPIIACEEVNLSLEYGNSPLSAPGYADFGIVVSTVLNKIEEGYQFGQLAVEIAERLQAKSFQSMTIFKVAGFTLWHKQKVKQAITSLEQAYLIALETGDLVHVLVSLHFKLLYTYLSGTKILDNLLEEIKVCESNFGSSKRFLSWTNIISQSIFNLIEYQTNPDFLVGEYCNEEELLVPLVKENDETSLVTLFLSKLILSYLFGHFSTGVNNAELAEKYLQGSAGMLSVPIFYYYDSLCRLAVYPNAEPSLQTELLLKIQENQAKLKIYVQSAPINFQNKYDLVEAECYRILGNKAEAIEYYDRAIAGARENQFLNEEALANELAAKFYLSWNKEKIAQTYMIDAYYCYLRWGAKAKLKDLIQGYPQLLGSIQQLETLDYHDLSHQKTLNSSSDAHQTTSQALDFLTIFQASQALSSEIRLDKLIVTLLQAIFANAGANQGVLLLVNENNLTIEAIAKHGEEPQVLLKLPVEKSSEVPLSLIYTVKRTQETIVIPDARQERWLSSEAYIIQKQPLSVLCTPILQQGKLLGILYLENNLTIGAFTSDRIEVLNLLCTQAAISLENARLYQQSQVYGQQLEQYLDELQASQARFAKLADNIPGVIYQLRINADGSISVPYVSSGCYDLYEVAPEEIMTGRRNFVEMEHPEDHSEVQKLTQESAQNLTRFFHEWRIITPSGMIKWVQGSSRPERQADGSTVWDGIVVDISDRKEAELALQESQHFIQQIADSSPNILYLYDLQQQRNVYVNREIGAILGYTPEEIQAMGKNFFSNLMHPEDLQLLPAQMARLQAAQDGEIIESEYRMRHANGQWRWLYSRDSVFSRDSSGRVKQSIGTAQDISDRKQAEKLLAEYNQTLEKEVAERTEQLSQTLAELQRTQDQLLETRKIAALGSLVAGVAHEVNTPVGTSITLASTLVDQTTTLINQAEQGKLKRSDLNNYLNLAQECSHIILTNLNRAGELIQTFKQIAVDQKPIESYLISLKAFLEEIVFSLSPNFRSLGHQVTISGDENISIKTDPTALAQVVTNLLMNSLKHAYKTDEVGHLQLNLLPQDDGVVIEFSDDGCGIPQEHLNRIFEPFFTTARHQGGTGLGLHIVHNLISQKLQGKIDVESEVGKGTIFRLTLPSNCIKSF